MDFVAKTLRVTDRPNARPVTVTKGEVAFERVSFHYGRDGGVIEDFTLNIAPGQKVGSSSDAPAQASRRW